MENVECICTMKKLMAAIRELESNLLDSTGCDLNQAMLLCVIADDSLSATEIASQIGVLPAQNSKLLAAAEDRGWVMRRLGHDAKDLFQSDGRRSKSIGKGKSTEHRCAGSDPTHIGFIRGQEEGVNAPSFAFPRLPDLP